MSVEHTPPSFKEAGFHCPHCGVYAHQNWFDVALEGAQTIPSTFTWSARGGPRGVYGDGVFHEFQILASEGYAVVYTHSRGSEGYGEDFAEAVMRHYGECDYEDMMLFTDEVLKRFDGIDAERLRVLGGSYGGYMTNWIIGHTRRFAAAVTFRSICNWVRKFGVSDMGHRQPEVISGTKDYWEDILLYLDRSPIR